MKRAILFLALSCIACTEPPAPDTASLSLEAAFTDTSRPRSHRLDAGIRLLQRPDGAAFLARQYRSGSRPLVRVLLDTLETLNPARAALLAAHLLEAAQGEEKIDIEAVLLRQKHHAVQPLAELLSRNPDWQTQMQALDALGKIGAPEALEPVAAKLNAPETWVRLAAAHALGEIGGEIAVPPLFHALDDTADAVVAAALIGLGRTGDRRAVSPGIAHLSHPNPRVRGAAASALGRLEAREAIAHLEPLLQDPDEGVRYKTRQALESLRRP